MCSSDLSKEELESLACKWWPNTLVEIEEETSIIPTLIRTQDQFISILTLASSNQPDTVFDVIAAANFPTNRFPLKF